MATKKSPTRKTTKPKTTAVKARTSKVSTKVTAVKAVAKQAPKVQANRLAFLSLERLWIAAIILFVGLAAATFLMQPVSYMVTMTHLTKDTLLSQDNTVFISASRSIWDFELRWGLMAFMLLSAVLPVLYLTKLKDVYTQHITKRRLFVWRWVDLAISAAFMIEVIAMLCGYSDIATLKLMGGAVALAAGLGWLAEQQNETAKKPIWTAFTASAIAATAPWLFIGLSKVGTLLFSEIRSPWYVYALCASTLIGLVLLAANQFNQHRRFGAWKDYAIVERNYAVLSIVTKVAFAGILIVGLAK